MNKLTLYYTKSNYSKSSSIFVLQINFNYDETFKR